VPEATPLGLTQGWNLVPYVRTSSMNVGTAIAALGSSVTVMKNSVGQVFWPAYGINAIGSMVPGQAYQMYLTQSATLTYPANALAKTDDASSVRDVTVHYPPLAERGGNNEVALIKAPGFSDGDEIAVRTSGNILAGTGVVKNGAAIVTIWSDDAYTKDVVEGAIEGEPLSLAHWSKSDGIERSLTIAGIANGLTGAAMTTGLVFTTNAVVVAQAVETTNVTGGVPTDYSLSQNYPNPFNPSTAIKYSLPADGQVTLELFTILGARVRVLVNESQHAGAHEINVNASDLSSGVYIYVLKSGSFTASKRMVLLK
jgi:hypothetical protein